MAIKITQPTKEGYIEQIKAIGKTIIDKADSILEDYHDHIKEIEIIATIQPMAISDIQVNKKYSVCFQEEEIINE